jgi:hypothetical protein
MMRAPQMQSPAPRAYAENRANRTSLRGAADSAKPSAEPLHFATIDVANRYRLPMHVAALIARLADIGSAL